jgi:hypothetical protein
MLEENRRAPVRLLLVWMPVLATDVAPPTARVLGKARDARATQHWDPDRALSRRLLSAAKSGALDIPEAAGKTVMWDFVLAYPPGVTWGDSIPRPEYYGGPIVDARVASEVRARVRRAGG